MQEQVHSDPGQITFGQEILRKTTHMFALVLPGGYYFLELNRAELLVYLIPSTILVIILDISRLRGWQLWFKVLKPVVGRMVRSHEAAGDFTGATYILITFCFVVAVFDKPVAIAALAFIIVGDTFAALVGRRWGKHRFFNGKSIEGSIACLIGTLIVAIFTPNLIVPVAVTGAVVAAFVEALPLGIDDNVSVPLLSGLVMTLLSAVLMVG